MKRVFSLLLAILVVFSTSFSASITVYAGYDANLTAHKKVYGIIQDYVDPDYILNSNLDSLRSYYGLSDSQITKLRNAAKKAVKGCKTDYKKIEAINKFVANRIYYDYDFYEGRKESTYTNPYKVFKNKRTVCEGYAGLVEVMLTLINIPCMYASGELHLYNIAYDSKNDEWIYFDATWASGNEYRNGESEKGSYRPGFFDMSLKKLSKLSNHEVYGVNGIVVKGVLYSLNTPIDGKKWTNVNEWYISVSGAVNPKNVGAINYIQKSFKKIPVTVIDAWAFEKCTGLTSITIPNSIITIDDSVFSGCENLSSITFSNSVTKIGNEAFYKCKSLTSVTLPNSLKTINYSVFKDCVSLTSITIPNSVNSIGDNVFSNCTSLASITIPNSVKTIGKGTFSNCTKLASVSLGTGVTKIGEGAFAECKSLDSVYINDVGAWCNITFDSWASNPFEYAQNLYIKGKLATDVVIPNGVTNITDSAFQNYSKLKSITIPNSVKNIGAYAFSNCTNIASITIPNSVQTISEGAFSDCTNLSSIVVPDSVKSIGEGVFNNTAYYNNADNWKFEIVDEREMLGHYILYIGNHLISANLYRDSYIVKSGMKTIAGGAFANEDIVSIKIPGSVISIGEFAFSCCSNLVSITIPDSVKTIGRNAFYNCPSITSIVLPNGITVIDSQTFDGCCNLKSITIPNTLKSISYYAFSNCDSLTDVYYKGSIVQWSKIKVADDNERLLDANIHFGLIEKPTVPVLKSVSNEKNGVKISWKSVLGADKYYVYRKVKGGSYSKIGETTKNYYTDKKAKSGKKYYYVVKAVNKAGISDSSSSKSILHLADPTLKKPSSIQKGIVLKWNKITGAQGYMVYRKTGSGSYKKLATVKGKSKITYTDKKAKKGKTYTYKIKAYKTRTYSAYSNAKKIKDKY